MQVGEYGKVVKLEEINFCSIVWFSLSFLGLRERVTEEILFYGLACASYFEVEKESEKI